MSATYYVAGLLFGDSHSKVMLIRKARPEWMRGKLNGIGGHIEPGEFAIDAMCREFLEETGLTIDPHKWSKFALLGDEESSKPWLIHWYTAAVVSSNAYKPSFDPISPGEPVGWYPTNGIITQEGLGEPVMPNLPWLVAMAIEHLDGTNRVQRYYITEKYSTE